MSAAVQPPRMSPSIREVDERVAAGDWSGFDTTVLCTEEGAVEILREGSRLRKEIVAAGGDQAAVLGFAGRPFRWKQSVFRVAKAVYVGGRAEVEVTPPDDEFEAELRARIEGNRFHTLDYVQGFGYVCFPEDYAKYKG